VHGLCRLNETTRIGLKLLIEAAGLQKGQIDSYGINFGIAPRINAMGRIASGMDALRALCTKDQTKAKKLINMLSDTNTTRQELTGEMLQLALSQQESWREHSIIVVAAKSFHEGVIGLIAGKLTETFHKPSVVFALGEETAKGSARSIAGVHITNLLRSMQDDLLEVGGHPMAGGLKIETKKLEIVKTRLQTIAKEAIDTTILTPVIDVDCALPPELVGIDTAAAINTLAPFGSGNPEPTFLLEEWMITDVQQIGKDGKHLKLKITNDATSNDQQKFIDGLYWNRGELVSKLKAGTQVDIIGKLQINVWKEKKSLQIIIQSLH
jgi:single-stranded-DNA-specific exonuclease